MTRQTWPILPILLMAVLYGCSEQDPLKIGFVGGLEGRASDVGIESRNAVQMAVDQLNETGGIDGRQVQLLIRDDKASAAGGAAAASELIEEGVDAVIGPNLSSVAAGIIPVANEAKIAVLSPTVSSHRFAGKDDYFFRVNSTTRQATALYAEHLIEAGYRRVAAANDARNPAFSESWLNEFRTHFEKAGGEVSVAVAFDSARGDINSQIAANLLAGKPGAVVMIGNGVDVALLAQQIRRLDPRIKLLAAGGSASESLTELGGSAVEGLELFQAYDRNDTGERFVQFRAAYVDRFRSEPGYASVAAYDAATILFSALQARMPGQDLKTVMEALPPIQGLQQELIFDAFGESNRRGFFVIIENGAFVRK